MYIFIAFIYLQLTLSKYINETIVVNVELTLFTAAPLNISDNKIQTEIAAAYKNTNTATNIFDTDYISIYSNYNYLNENDDFEFMAIFHAYFESENDYNGAINKYTTNGFIDSFVIQFENHIQSQLADTISTGNSFNKIVKVLINSLKLIKLDLDDNVGSILVKYNGDTTTTLQPTISMSPSISPTVSPTNKETSVITTIIMKDGNTANYTFDSDAPYWILLIFFLFIGCGFGCCCWYIFCIKYSMFNTLQKHMEEEGKKPDVSNKRHSNSRNKKQTNNGRPIKQTSTKRNVDVSIEMGGRKKKTKKKTPKTPKGPNKGKGKSKDRNRDKVRTTKSKRIRSHTFDDTKSIGSGREEGKETIDEDATRNKKKVNNKRERYIEYGSDDDSDQSERVFTKKLPKSTNLRARPQSVIIHKSYNDEVSSSDDDNDNDKQKEREKNKKRYSYSSTASDQTMGTTATTPRPKKRNKNKKTGNVEPDRYDDDGNRILTTKELMAQYKKNGAKPSVELSYKVGGKKKKKRKKRRDDDEDDDEDEDEDEDESMGDTGDEYQFDIDSNSVDSSTMSGMSHRSGSARQQYEQYQQQKQKRKKLEKINEKEKEKRPRDRKKKGNNHKMGHKRSATDFGGNRRSKSGGPRKRKLVKKRLQRPESARFKDNKYNKPIKMKRPQSAKPKGKKGKKRRVEREFYDNNHIHDHDDDDDDDEDEEEDDDETPQPKRFNQNNTNYDDEDDDDESSGYYE